jgi:tetratricopeptide (TPR) repeat protein
MDKFSVVFEFNKNSPLITYQASKEIEAGNYKKALDMLSTAVEKYPGHYTAYLLLSVALAYNKKYDEAKDIIHNLDNSVVTAETSEFYLKEIEKIRREAEGISVSFDETVAEVLNDSFLDTEQFEADKDFQLIDDNLENINADSNFETDEAGIVTETLAEIYASQNNYDEALDIYEKLKKIKPEMEEKFNKRISEIEEAIENKRNKKIGN